MSEPIGLYWWRGEPNFGDALSPLVTEWVAGAPVGWANQGKCNLVALGSILQGIRKYHQNPRPDGSKPFIWGSGVMFPVGGEFTRNVRIQLLRGPLTASAIGHSARRFGDPGLLAQEALGLGEVARDDRIALVPHRNLVDDPMLAEILKMEPALKLVDPRGEVHAVCREIASAAHVISSSLHGLIVADSFGVANTWLDPRGIHGQAHFKFYDYAAGVERPLAPPLMLDEVPDYVAGLKSPHRLSYAEGLEKSKTALVERFPRILRAA